METVAQGRTNIAPKKIPWELIRTLITETYGGKIDDAEDFEQLSDLITNFMTPAAFEIDHQLVKAPIGEAADQGVNDGGLRVPEGNDMGTFMSWVDNLPEREPPTHLGLPANAEKLLLIGHGRQAIDNLVKIQELLEENEQLDDEGMQEADPKGERGSSNEGVA